MKFADDSKLWGRVNSQDDIAKMQGDLNTLNIWANENLMPFNVEKCKVMHIGKNNNKAKYTLMNETIHETIEEKDLGVFFTNSFKPSLNCNSL